MNQIEITWDAATEISLQHQKEEIQSKERHSKNIERANLEFMDAIAGTDFRGAGDFADICYWNGIDQDDLINRLI